MGYRIVYAVGDRWDGEPVAVFERWEHADALADEVDESVYEVRLYDAPPEPVTLRAFAVSLFADGSEQVGRDETWTVRVPGDGTGKLQTRTYVVPGRVGPDGMTTDGCVTIEAEGRPDDVAAHIAREAAAERPTAADKIRRATADQRRRDLETLRKTEALARRPSMDEILAMAELPDGQQPDGGAPYDVGRAALDAQIGDAARRYLERFGGEVRRG